MIPRTIHQFWGGSPLPEVLRELSATWLDHHPGWAYVLWNEDSIRAFDILHQDLYDRADQIVPADAVWQFRSDILRWAILWRYGGVWADMDTTCQRSIEPLLTRSVVAGWEVQGQWVGSSVLAATPGHPVISEICAAMGRLAHSSPPGTRPNVISGPKAITRPLLERRRRHRDVRIVDERLWYPVRWSEAERSTEPHPAAYIVHHWAHQRSLRGLPPPTLDVTGAG